MAVPIDSASKYREAVGQLLAAYQGLLNINEEYIALGIGSSISDTDFADITQAEFVDGVAAAQTVVAAITVNETNLYRVSDGSQR